MRWIREPRQRWLFDPFQGVLSEMARQRIGNGWQGVFRAVVLEQLPVSQLARHFSADTGCPTKELYSMAGLVFLADFFDWDAHDAADAYMMRLDVQFALNLEPGAECSDRTVERYRKLFTEDDAAATVFADVTTKLVELLDLDVSQQRLDSTHVHSHMATFGRTRLLAVAIKRCLTQIKRHAAADFHALPEDLRARYAPSEGKLFGDAKTAEARARSRQQVSEDMRLIVERFADHVGVTGRTSYTSLVKIFHEQCVVVEGRVELMAKTGGDVIQNPSDLDATYDGHKGQGYQIQLSETCSAANEVQLIVGAIPETACASDANAVRPMLEQLESRDMLPEEMTADTAYGSDGNCVFAESRGVELIAPIPGKAPQLDPAALTLDDFAHKEVTGAVEACPAGHAPLQVTRTESTETGVAVLAVAALTIVTMSAEHCAGCPLLKSCPIQHKADDTYELKFTDHDLRLAARRREQDTEVFRERYSIRSGIESTNSGLKNRLGLGHLKVRGRGSVFRQLLLKVTGWNVLRAAASEAVRTKVAERLAKLLGTGWSRRSGHLSTTIPSLHNAVWTAHTPPNNFRTGQPRKSRLPNPTTTFAA